MKLSILFFKKFILSSKSDSVIRKISFISFLSISASAAALAVIISVMNGFGEAIEARLLSFEPHIVVTKSYNNGASYQNVIDFVKKQGGYSFTFYHDQVIVRTIDGQYSGAIAKGLAPESIQHFIQSARQGIQSRAKRLGWGEKVESDLILSEGDIIIGSDLAYQLGVFIGDVLTVTPPESLLLPSGDIPQTKKLTIQDVIRTGVQSIDSSLIMYSNHGDGALFENAVSTENHLEIFMPNQRYLDEFTSYLNKNKYEFSTWVDRNSALFYSLEMEKKLITFFLIVAFLIGSFSMVSILVLLSTQKKQEMGIMLSLGISSSKIKKVFTHIGFLISMTSVVIGLVIGILVCLFLDNTRFIQLPDIYYDRSLPVKFDLSFYLGILFLSLGVSFFSSYLPSRYLIRFSPQDIIRKK